MRALWLVIGGALIGAALILLLQRAPSGQLVQDATLLAAQAGPPSAERQAPIDTKALELSYAPVAKRVAPAVVNIYTARLVRSRMIDDPFFRPFFGGRSPRPRIEQSLGSGVIVQADGLVVTNNHVIEGADEILVALADRREFRAKLLFADPRTDLALLKIEPRGQTLPVARLGDSDRAEVGDIVLAIGNPFGVGQTVTHGIVSAVARTGVGVSDYQFFLQTDAPVNPGNSGGALVSLAGEVIGINSAIYSRSGGSSGVGFSIPSNMVRQFLAAARTGKFVHAWIGVEGRALTPDLARAAGLDRPAGVLVTAVSPGSPAAAARIKPGDVIFAVDGKEVADPDMLRYRIASQPVNGNVTATVIRDAKARNIKLTLVPPPERPARDVTQLRGDNLLTGVTVANLSPAMAQEVGAGVPEHGVVVVDIAPGAPAAQLRFLQPGDVIEAVNGERIDSVRELRSLLPAATEAMALRFSRAGQAAECVYRAPETFYCRT